MKTGIIAIDELIANPIFKYTIENLVYHLSKTDGKIDDIMKLCSTVTDLQYMCLRLHTSQMIMSAKDLPDDRLTEEKIGASLNRAI